MEKLNLNHWLFGITLALVLSIKPNPLPINITCQRNLSAQEAQAKHEWHEYYGQMTLQEYMQSIVYEPVDMPSEMESSK